MQNMIKRINRWLLPTVLILFILQVVMLPWAIGFTWADRSESPSHILTYTQNELTWDSATGIRADGSAELKLFSAAYDNTVHSANGDKVIAPGTSESMYVRLKNNVSGSVVYTAVLYEIKSDERVPVKAVLSGKGFTDTANYTLPQGVSSSQVIRAVTGSVAGGQIQDFDMNWLWDYYESARQDAADTMLGNMTRLPEITVGLYIVVEDDNVYDYSNPDTDKPNEPIRPGIPKTGDEANMGFYIALMTVSFILLLLLLWERKREAKRERN